MFGLKKALFNPLRRIVFLGVFFCTQAYGLQELKLRSLLDFSSVKIDLSSKKPKVLMLFQKDCHACRGQVKELSCLKGNAEVFLVGSFSREKDLRKEYRIFGTEFKGVYGDKGFKRAFKIKEKLTPQIILGKNQKYEILLGAQSCNSIRQKLKDAF